MRRTHGVFALPLFGVLLAFAACSGDGSEACGRTEADPAASLAALQRRIEELGGDEAYPVVPLDLFFEGNHEPASIAPNLDPHPGMDTFRCVLRDIRDRPSVADVVVRISEVTYEDEWPYADSVYVITTETAREVHRWAAQLRPDPFDETVPDGWFGGEEPPGAPRVPAGHRVVILFWD